MVKSSSYSILIFFLFVSCLTQKNSVVIKAKTAKATTVQTLITLSSVKIVDNQFILTGTNLNSAISVVIKESGTTTALAIESQTATSLVANSLANLTLAAGKVFEFVVTNASASASFTVDFSLCSSSLGGKAIDCTTTPNDKEVLSYDANSQKWKPRSVNGLSYQGVWDATTSLPTATTEGDYFIVSVAGGSYSVGDWIVYNGTTFEKVSNSTVVTSVFTRTGAITATEGDYVLNKMGDVDFVSATPTTNQILQFNGTNWVPATLSSAESDPLTKTFAKTTLPTCASGQVLKGDGTSLSCVAAVSVATTTELGYVSGVTSSIQTQLNAFQAFAKTPIPTCNSGEVLKSNGTTFSCVTDSTGSGGFSGTASRAIVTDGSGALAVSASTSTEIGYLSGVTSAIQTQFTNVAATAAALASTDTTLATLTSGNIFVGSAGNVATSLPMSGDATIANTGALTIAADSVALSTDTTGNYVLNLTASNGLQATAAAGEGTTPNLVLGGTLSGNTTFTQGTSNVLFDLTGTGIFSVLAGANGLSVSNLGVTTLSSGVLTTADINGGTLDGVTIGASTRAPAAVTTIEATAAYIATASISNALITSADINGGTVDGTTIGATTASSGAFTTLSTTGATSIGGALAITSGTAAANKVLQSDVSGNATWSFSGSVLQVVYAGISTSAASSSTTWVDSGVTATITPKSSTSKIVINATLAINYLTDDAIYVGVKLVKDATDIFTNDYAHGIGIGTPLSLNSVIPVQYVDAPATTSATTYKIQFRRNTYAGGYGGTVTVNSNASNISNITLMEIGQ